jgi:DNA-directed RNA polymerase specialized sigma24 family protein
MKNVTSKHKDKRAHAVAWYGRPYDADDIGEKTVVAALRGDSTTF